MELASEQYGGIFVERDRVSVTVGQVVDDNEAPLHLRRRIQPFDDYRAELEIGNASPSDLIFEAVKIILDGSKNLRAVGIGSYGPFLSLDRPSPDQPMETEHPYGMIPNDPKFDLLFGGVNLHDLVKDSLADQGVNSQDVPVAVHTDAMVCAIGEAIHIQNPQRQVLTYLFLTDGVGGASVVGAQPMPGSLHPEMGRLHVRYMDEGDDVFVDSLPKSNQHYQGAVGDIVDFNSMLFRARESGLDPATLETLHRSTDDAVWRGPAFYIAQLCLACESLISPKQIILGGRLAVYSELLDGVRKNMERLAKNRIHGEYMTKEGIEQLVVQASDVESDVPLRALDGTLQLAYSASLNSNSVVQQLG